MSANITHAAAMSAASLTILLHISCRITHPSCMAATSPTPSHVAAMSTATSLIHVSNPETCKNPSNHLLPCGSHVSTLAMSAVTKNQQASFSHVAVALAATSPLLPHPPKTPTISYTATVKNNSPPPKFALFPPRHCKYFVKLIPNDRCNQCYSKVPKEIRKAMVTDWLALVDSRTEYDYKAARMKLEYDYKTYPNFLKYICDLCDGHKEKFVACWTNKTKHLGNRTTNRVEGAHASLKKYILNSCGNLENMVTYIINLLSIQHNRTRGSLGNSMNVVKRTHEIPHFSTLQGKCSINAIDEMLKEICQIEWTRADPTCSDCEITLVYNLPCCHVIRNYENRGFPIPLECIDHHCKKLRFDEETANAKEDNIGEHLKHLMRKYGETNDPILQQNLKAQLEMLYDPSKTTAKEPETRPSKRNTSSGRGKKTGKYSTKREQSAFEYTEFYKDSQNELRRSHSTRDDKFGRTPRLPPRYSAYEKGKTKLQSSAPTRKPLRYMEQILAVFHDHIREVNDVAGDGHCGFRVIAKALGMRLGANDWRQVRQDLFQEIDENPTYYLDILGQLVGYEEVRNSFLWHNNSPPPHEKWMYFPGSGFVIASNYNVAVVNICEYGNGFGTSTYLPIRTAPPSKPVLIVMAHVNLNHYVEIIYDQSKTNFRPFPMPPIVCGWKLNCSPEARRWEEVYRPNLKYYVALQRLSRPTTYGDPTEISDIDEK